VTDRREKVLQTAEKLVARGKLTQAIKEYRKLLRENPNDPNTLNRVGDLYARQDKVDDAIALFQRIAEGYGRDGFFVKAIAIYKKIIRLDPTRLEIYEKLAELYHRQGLVSEARSQYQVLGDYYQKHGDMAATIEIHRKIADLEPADPSPRVKLAELYLQQGLIEETIGEYQRIAEVMLDHGRVDDATKVYLRALDLDSDDLAFISEAVIRLREEGEHEAAAQVFDAAVKLNPEAAKLAERMKAHEAEITVETVEEEAPAEDDSVGVAEILDAGVDPSEPVSAEELKEIEASSDVSAVQPAEDGTFVIDLDGEAESAAEVSEEEALEIDLDELEAEIAADSSKEEAPRTARQGKADPMASIDALAQSLGVSGTPEVPSEPGPAAAEPSVPEVGAPIASGVEVKLAELVAEAEVFGKYGLESKAIRRLEQAIEVEPTYLEAHKRLVLLHLQKGGQLDVLRTSQRMLDSADAMGGEDLWDEVLGALAAAGYTVEEGVIGHGGKAAVDEPPPAEPELEPAPTPAEDAEGLEWLEAPAEAKEDKPDVFEAEEEFFDLAAELEKEIVADEAAAAAPEVVEDTTPTGDESLQDIVEGFKKGVAEVLSPEDYDTHYNLGIAYREMGLVDEAIGEFQLSAKAPEHLVDSCSMLGACFLEKGFPDLAVQWYKSGLEAADLDEEGSLALKYDLGSVYASSGDREAAYEVFVEIYGINSHFRDVVARLEELRAE
jgi:tetratricopeptide (TPR) repeat protein